MAITVACGSCAKRFRANEKLAGKSVKCPECGGVLTIPSIDPAKSARAPAARVESEMGQGTATSAPMHAANNAAAETTLPSLCPACARPLDAAAVLCVNCGYDTRVGRKIATVTGTDFSSESPHDKHLGGKPSGRISAVARSTSHFVRGCVFGLVGALIGAGIWYGVAVGLQRELGWIAWLLGFLAGAGMAIGNREGDDGAGIAAAGISLLGILAAKWMIYANCMVPEMSSAAWDALYGEGETVPGFFSLMFGPIDGIFVLLAFFTAYKVGSGKPTSED